MSRRLTVALGAWIVLLGRAHAVILDVDMVVGASGRTGGTLRIVHDFSRPILVTPIIAAGGVTRYTSTQPGFDAVDPLTEAEPGFQPVQAGTPIRVEVTAVDAGASFKLGSVVLDAPGAAAALATAPNLHVHGEWRLLLPDGVVGAYSIAFRLTTTSPAYTASPPYVFTLVNAPDVVPPTTTTTLPATGAVLVPGRRLALSARKGLAVASAAAEGDVPVAGGPDDPAVAGGSLEVRADTFDATLELPATGWRRLGRAGAVRGYRYASGPHRVVLKRGRRLALAARAPDVAPSLDTDPGPVEVILDVGARRYCLYFGGARRFTAGRRLRAVDAPPPPTCEEPS